MQKLSSETQALKVGKILGPLDYGISPDRAVKFNEKDWELARVFMLDLSSRVQAIFPLGENSNKIRAVEPD